MPIGCPVPSNINPLSPNGFKFSIARIPELTYFSQEVALPDVSLPEVEVSTPFIQYPLPGDMMKFDDLAVRFIIDSTMSNYIALFKWLRGLGFPENNNQYLTQVQVGMEMLLSENAAAMSDATLSILGNTNNVIQTVLFKDCVITNLSALPFTSVADDVTYLVGDAIFSYSYYTFL